MRHDGEAMENRGRIGCWAICVLLLMPAIGTAAGTEYDRLNQRLAGRGVRVALKRGVLLRGRCMMVSAEVVRILPKKAQPESGSAPIDIPVGDVAYIDDEGQGWAKVAGAFGGIGVGALGGLVMAVSAMESDNAIVPLGMFVGSVAAGGTAGQYIGAKVSSQRYYLEPEGCIQVELPAPAPSRKLPQITFSGTVGRLDKALPSRGFGIGVQVPLTGRLKIVGDFAYSKTKKRTDRFTFQYTDYNDVPHQDDDLTEEVDREYELQVQLRYTWRDKGRFRPYAEGGYGIAIRKQWVHALYVRDQVQRQEYTAEDRDVYPFRLVGGVGCEVGLYRNLALDVRAQFGTFVATTARVSAGIRYGF